MDQYRITVRAMGGLLLFGGSVAFSLALDQTLLRAGGNLSSRALYVAAGSSAGVGAVSFLACWLPVNALPAELLFAAIATSTGILWWRFYRAAAA